MTKAAKIREYCGVLTKRETAETLDCSVKYVCCVLRQSRRRSAKIAHVTNAAHAAKATEKAKAKQRRIDQEGHAR